MRMFAIIAVLTICWEAHMVAPRKYTPRAEAIIAAYAGRSGDDTRDALKRAGETYKYSDAALASKRAQLSRDEPALMVDLPVEGMALAEHDVELAAYEAHLLRVVEEVREERIRTRAALAETYSTSPETRTSPKREAE